MNEIKKQLFNLWEKDQDEAARKLLWEWQLEKDWGARDMIENKMISYLEEKGICSKDSSSD